MVAGEGSLAADSPASPQDLVGGLLELRPGGRERGPVGRSRGRSSLLAFWTLREQEQDSGAPLCVSVGGDG